MSMDAEMTVGFMAFKERYVSRVTCVPYESVEVRFRAKNLEGGCADFAMCLILKCNVCGAVGWKAVASSSTPLFRTLTTTWRFQRASPQSPHASAGGLREPGHGSEYENRSPVHESRSPARVGLDAGAQVGTHSGTRVGTPAGDDGPTLVTLDLVYAFANPVHATISAAFFGQVSKLMVKAFEERCLEVYGPGRK